MKKIYPLLLLICAANATYSQQGFGTSNPAPSSVIDMVSSNKGTLLPRVSLTSTTVAAPVTSPANALTVFNTNTAGNVTPGYYYWSTADSKWIRLSNSNDVDVRLVGTANHISQDAGVGSNGTSVGTGTDNIAIGKSALSNNTIGKYNLAFGTNALTNNTTGTYNIGTGYNSLAANTTGNGNIAYGSEVLRANQSGNDNVAFGASTLQSNTTGSQNVGIGGASLQNSNGSYNAAVGANALKNNISGNYNTASGFNSLGSVTTGSYNVGVGINAANNLTTGSFNVVVGVGTVNDPAADNQINIGDAIWGTNKNIGLSDLAFAPAERLDVAKGNVRVRDINTNTGTATDKIVVADATGVLKTIASTSKFFYAPSVVLPTINVNLPAYTTYNSGTGTFTVDLYAIYSNQYGMTGNAAGAGRTAIKNPTATTLPVETVTALEYFVTYFDNTVFDPNSIALNDAGVLTYKILPAGVVTENTFMNIVFKLK